MAESLGVATLDLTTDDSRLRSGLRRGEQDTRSSFGRMSAGVLRSAAGIATAFGAYKLGKALFTDPIKMAGNFQTTLNVLRSVTGGTTGDMEKLRGKALQLGADLRLPGTSAQDAADAMVALGKAGFNTNEIMAASHGILLLSAAAEVDNATAADLVTKALGAFGLQAKDTNLVVNDFAGAANASQSSLLEVGEAMTQAGAGFKALRVPIGDAATAIAVMAKHGITGSMAGSALNVAFSRLANPTTKMTATLKDMGVQLFDSNDKFVGMRSAISQMSPKLAQMSDKQRLATLAILGGTRGMKALSFVLGTGVKDWDKIKAAVQRAGQAQEIANAKTSGYRGALEGLRSTFENLQIAIGTKLLPKATEFLKFLTKIAGAKSFSIAISIVWKGVVSLAGDLKEAIRKALFGNASDVAFAQGWLRVGKEAIVVDPGLVAQLRSTIDGLIAKTDWGALGKRIGDGISKTITISTNAMNTMLNAMLAWVNANSGKIAEVGIIIGLKAVSKILDPAFWAKHWQLIGGVILAAASMVFTPARFAGLAVKLSEAAFGLFGATVGKVITTGLGKLPGVVGDFAPKFASSIGGMIAGAITLAIGATVRLVAAVINRISGGFGRLGGIVKTLLYTGVVGAIGNVIGEAAGEAKRLASRILNSITSGLTSLGGKVGEKLKAATTAVENAAEKAGAAALQIGQKIVSGAVGGIIGLADLIKRKIEEGIRAGIAAVSPFSPIEFGAAKFLGVPIMLGAAAGVKKAAPALADATKGAFEKAGDAVKSVWDMRSPSGRAANELGKPLIQGIIVGINKTRGELNKALADTVTEAGEHGGRGIEGVTKKMTTVFDEWAKNVKTKMAAGFDVARTKINAEFAKAQAKLDEWKASMTPTEALLASMQAKAALASVENAVTNAKAALAKLDADFNTSWAKLLADQAANMAKLKSIQAVTETDEAIAGHQFSQALAGASPMAVKVLEARQALDTAKKLYAEHNLSQAELFAAQDAFDAASLAAAETADASQLLQDYDTWQNLIKQTAEGALGIQTQEATDAETRATAAAAYGESRVTANAAVWEAMAASDAYWLNDRATKERKARDDEYVELDAGLVKRHKRTLTHIENQEHAWDLHFKAIIKQAHEDGQKFGDAYVDAINDLSKPGGKLETAVIKVANIVKKYLKLNSPAEKGPLSTLDKWWTQFTPTLLKGLDTKRIEQTISGALNPRLNAGLMGAYASDKTRAQSMAGAGQQTNNITFHETPADADPTAISESIAWRMKTLRT